MKIVNTLIASSILGILALGSTSCSSTSSAVGSEIAPSETAIMIERGMPAADLIAALGEPKEVKDVEPPKEGFEIWVYRKSSQGYDLKVTGYKETPYWNPITGQYTPIQDPVYKGEHTSVIRETQFLVGEGVVLSWKDDIKEDRYYTD